MNDIELLRQFLEYPIWTSNQIFERFRSINNHIFRENNNLGKERFLFIEGNRKNKVVLVAHADTYFDVFYNGNGIINHNIEREDDYFIGRNENGQRIALGADDRAGCAILWALKDSGHSILITDGEERGRIGSTWLMQHNPDIAEKINLHQFMIQFDRRNAADFKCYDVGTDAFRTFIQENTNYTEDYGNQRTDICTLCEDICGVNISVGYYDEHTIYERINYKEWLNTLNITRNLISNDLPRFLI
jgi:hypothetical protein